LERIDHAPVDTSQARSPSSGCSGISSPAASVDSESRLHIAFASGKRIDVRPQEHLDWQMDDWIVCGTR
jgi:hypothetical protein